jgi:hypothetical protein
MDDENFFNFDFNKKENPIKKNNQKKLFNIISQFRKKGIEINIIRKK